MSRTEKERIRFTVDLTEADSQRLKDLEDKTGATTKADVVRLALRFYETIVRKDREGFQFFLEKEGQKEWVLFIY